MKHSKLKHTQEMTELEGEIQICDNTYDLHLDIRVPLSDRTFTFLSSVSLFLTLT